MASKRPADDDPNLVSKIQRVHLHAPLSPQHRAPATATTNNTIITTTAAATAASATANAPPSSAPAHSNVANDFSGSVKKKLADSKRTGQACDRCKVRKIRCDGRPEGCTPCEQNRTPCRTTDRITGRATVRGHAEAMESENSYLRAQIADLQAQLKENGVEPRLPPAYGAALQQPSNPWPSAASDASPWSDGRPRRTSSSPLPGYAPATTASSKLELLPQFKHGSIGDNYLGVASVQSPLSHIKGTSLSIFGTDIDITDFTAAETEYEKEATSYSTLVKIAMGNHPVETPQLPPYNELNEYAIWYMRSINPYTMLVHKPAFMQLIWRIGNDPSFTPTGPETVTVHMMLATIMYQIAVRNSDQGGSTLLDSAHAHYKYALTFFKQLVLGEHGWQDVQALAMICHHLRTFPKPGAAWIMTSIVYLFAVQLGLHRSVKVWEDGTGELTKLDIEMRKRVFWTLHAIQINLNGKLGRPMPVSNEDIDVEFPEPMNDCLPGEEANLDTFHQCSFQVGIQIAKYTVWDLELYKTIYAVRYSQKAYLESLKRLAAGIRQWKDEMPYELRDPSQAADDDYIFSLYLQYWYHSYMLLLHHPGVCRSTDAAILNSNLDQCLHASQKILHHCTELMNKKSLDIPWVNTVIYIAAAFTTLFISTTRQDQMTPSDMTKLKDDMASWVDLLGECDKFLGSGNRLKLAISRIVDQSLSKINDSIVKRTATESLARVAMQAPVRSESNSSVYDQSSYQDQYATTTSGPTDPILSSHAATYTTLPINTAHSYNLNTQVSVPSQTNRGYDQQSYNSGDQASMNPNHAAALAAAAAAASSNSAISQAPADAYAYSHAHMANTAHQQPTYTTNGYVAQEWTQWTRAYMQHAHDQIQQQQQQPGEYLNTATTLMTLGRDASSSHGTSSDGQGLVQTSGVQNHHHNHHHQQQQQHHSHNQHTQSHHPAPVHWPQIAFPNVTSGSH
ncbi:hypothetical protein COCVIDRAFT_83730 [Bipolaris victoriae FI3]|uniref:Zn(2)-C6 fungal-type domain-containing protein n=1 Tax=Bipolaris victoriae (strain FI3) TaxID=930091 RepID=W7FB15_BIPV3|nr:hypothetical protein COCVIDRAFT_83730 [Bipolaris victoriae FI3]